MTKRAFTADLDLGLLRWCRAYAGEHQLQIRYVVEQAILEYRIARLGNDTGPAARILRGRRGPLPAYERLSRAQRLEEGRKTAGRPALIGDGLEPTARASTGLVGTDHTLVGRAALRLVRRPAAAVPPRDDPAPERGRDVTATGNRADVPEADVPAEPLLAEEPGRGAAGRLQGNPDAR